jgi:hypothetical protein
MVQNGPPIKTQEEKELEANGKKAAERREYRLALVERAAAALKITDPITRRNKLSEVKEQIEAEPQLDMAEVMQNEIEKATKALYMILRVNGLTEIINREALAERLESLARTAKLKGENEDATN